jgi:hypothetical protein
MVISLKLNFLGGLDENPEIGISNLRNIVFRVLEGNFFFGKCPVNVRNTTSLFPYNTTFLGNQ